MPRTAVSALALIAAGCAGDAALFGPGPGPAPAPTVSFERLAIVGASVSYGMAGGPLAHIVEGRIAGAHEVASFADLYTFTGPVAKLRQQIEGALAFSPTAVLALDALFWCVYGAGPASSRVARLEACLAELSRIEAPLFVGDVPDMSRAAAWMLPPAAVPPPPELAAANDAIRRWAETRPAVRVIPLATWNQPLIDGDPKLAGLMSPDRLHPNRDGLLYILRRLAREVDGAGALGAI
jgi:hypothetical protein